MDLFRHLRCFVAVAEELHFGRAAERLHMSQPPLSQRIRALEQRIGAPLFARTSRRVELTPLGRRLLPEARALVEQATAVEQTLDGLSAADVQDIRIGLPPDLPAAVVGALLRAGDETDGGIDVEVVQGTPIELEQAVRAGKVAAAVLRHPLPADVVVGDAFERPSGVLIHRDSPLAARSTVELLELDGHDLVVPPRAAGPAQHDALVTELGALGWSPRTVRFADGPDGAAGVVLAGGAVALTSRSAGASDGLAWRPLAGGAVPVRVSVARRRGATQDELALVRVLEELLVDIDGWTRVARHAAGPPRPRPSSGLPW